MEFTPTEKRIHVNLDQVIQEDFLGVNATYHGFAYMPEQVAKGMDEQDAAREFERVQRMGLNIARTWYRPDWACGDSLANPYDWDSPKMHAFYRWLAAMKERNVEVALQAGWWFTRDTYLGSDAPDPDVDIDRYTRWVSESLYEMIIRRGFTNVRYLVLFTEPTSYASGLLPPGETQWSYYVRVVQALHHRLVAEGRRQLVQFVGPNNTHGGVHLAEAVKDLNSVLDIYSGHDYNKKDYAEWLQVCQAMQAVVAPTGKPFWLDEYGLQDEAARLSPLYGNYLAQAVAASLNAGHQASFLWLLFDQQYVSADSSGLQHTTNEDSFYNGVHRWGTWKWPHDTLSEPRLPYPHWYAFSLLSRFLGGRDGTLVLGVSSMEPLVVAATRPASWEYTLLIINTSPTDQVFTLQFSRNLNRTLYRYQYLPDDIQVEPQGRMPGFNQIFSDVKQTLEDELPGYVVAIYSSIRLQPGQPPAAPLWLRVGWTSQGYAGLTWLDRSRSETGYRVERWDVETDEVTVFKMPAGIKEFVDKTAQRPNAYVYRVCAFNNDGRSAWVYAHLR